jgi:hypothetical protein
MRRVVGLLNLQARELPGGGLEIHGTIPIAADNEEPLRVVVGGGSHSELGSGAPQDPCRDFTAAGIQFALSPATWRLVGPW